MAAISELIRTEGNGTLSFGDYTLGAKAKLDNYEFHGDKYKVKTFKEITKLERNGLFVYESVPGTAVTHHSRDEYKDLIEKNGGKNVGSISAKTSFILAGENMGPAKLEKAQKLGVQIMSEDEFLALIS